MLTQVRTGSRSVARTDPTRQAISIETWALAAIIALGAILRLATLANQSYWADEASTVHEMQLSLGALWHAIRFDESSPPLYFVLAWLWAKAFGTSEVGLRSLSALLGIGLIPLAYLSARELVSGAAGLLTAALVAVSPFMIWYSQEARPYMLFAVLCALSLLFFARARRTRSTRDLTWWSVFSALAMLTHFFAGFLVAPEAVWVLFAIRRRAAQCAVAAVAVVQAALIPLAVNDTSHSLQAWIGQFPVSIRVEQVPIDFAVSTLYQSTIVNDALLLTAALVGVVLALLIVGADRERLRGAALAAGLGAAIIVIPRVLAVFGSDYFVARNLIGAWLPLAILVAAACTAPRVLPGGAALATLLIGLFVYGLVDIEHSPQYQRPNWRGVAAALGFASEPRAITVYDGAFGAGPLSIYLPGVPWQQTRAPVTVRELDIVGNTWQSIRRPLPAGVSLIGTRSVDGYQIAQFALAGVGWHGDPASIGSRAAGLLYPAPPGTTTLVQTPHGTREASRPASDPGATRQPV